MMPLEVMDEASTRKIVLSTIIGGDNGAGYSPGW